MNDSGLLSTAKKTLFWSMGTGVGGGLVFLQQFQWAFNTANLEGLKGLDNDTRTFKDCCNTQPYCSLRSKPQYIKFSVKPYLPSVLQDVNPSNGVSFCAGLFGRESKERSFVNCYPHSLFVFITDTPVKILISFKSGQKCNETNNKHAR